MGLCKKVNEAETKEQCFHFEIAGSSAIWVIQLFFILIVLHWPYAAHAQTKESFQNDTSEIVDPVVDPVVDPEDISDPADPPQMMIRSFYAYVDNNRVIVEWETVSEDNIIGFHIKRLNPKNDKYNRINKKLLPGLLVAFEGSTYRFEDKTAQPGNTYTYKLIVKKIKGKQQVYGPFTIDVDDPGFEPPLAQDEAFAAIDVDGDRLVRKAKRQLAKANREKYKKRKPIQRKGKTGVYISLKDKGIYKVAAEDIAQAMGVPVQKVKRRIKKGKLALTYQNQEAAWQLHSQDDSLIFYGEDIDSLYTNFNAYRVNHGKGKQVTFILGNGPDAIPMTDGFMVEAHTEEDNWALTGLFDDPNEDYWLWDYLFAGDEENEQKSFLIKAPGLVADTEGSLTVRLKGSSEADHTINVMLNDIVLGETTFRRKVSHSVTLDVPPGVLTEGDNTVMLTAIEPPAGASIVYLDSFDLSYEKAFKAIEDQLWFDVEDRPVVTVGGFSNANIQVYDVTDPLNIIHIQATTINPEDEGTYRVSLSPKDPQTRYVALTANAVKSLGENNLGGYLAPHLMKTRHSADYLVITPNELKDQAQRLADYRQSRGLSTMVIILQDIYDEFNYGIANPEAVRDFLEYAWHNWRKPPRYVVRVGNGSYDYKDVMNSGDTLMPPLMVATPYGLFASENRLTDVDGSDDGLPEMMIGLLPADDSQALADMVDKIIAYEATSGDWKNNVLMVADNPDGGGNFPADSDAVAALVPDGYLKENIYLGELSLTEAREKLSEDLENGAFLMNYIGHAGYEQLTGEGLWTKSHVDAMTNQDRLPILVGMTCLAGRFEMPGLDAIGESIVVKANAGAVAAWVPTGLSLNFLARMLDKAFFTAVFADNQTVLGDAILTAMADYKTQHPVGHEFILDIYTLIGDPALTLK